MTNKTPVCRLSTGNEYISIPDVNASTGGIQDIGFLYNTFRANIELHGSDDKPLLGPVVEVGGENIFADGVESELTSYWVPRFVAKSRGITATSTIITPLDRRGFICVLSIENGAGVQASINAGWRGCWQSTYHAAKLSKMMAGIKHAGMSSWMQGVPVIEYRGHTPLFAMALVADEAMSACIHDSSEDAEITEWAGDGVSAKPGEPVHYALMNEYTLAPGEKKTIAVYVGVGLEEVSAIASAQELRLQGWDRALSSLLKWLDKRTIECNDDQIKNLINVNSFYNYFYSQGIALDSEDLVVTVSRSSRNDSCAAYADREAVLWSLPAVLQINWTQARKMLIYAFTTQLPNVGIHSRYINGIALQPGLQLDQLCAPIKALHSYVQATGDLSVLFDRRVQAGVHIIQQTLAAQRHPDVALFETLLLPSGGPSKYPYVCYSNVLVWRILRDLTWLYDRIRDADRAVEADTLANRVKAAVMAHFVVDGPFGAMYARGVDLQGDYEIGDDPVGSLQMLVYHDFCTPDDPVYLNTIKWIHSAENKVNTDSAVSVPGIINDLLTGRKDEALSLLQRATLDDGLACESIDVKTGEAVSGKAFANCAGYLAFGLRSALDLAMPETAMVPQKRRPSEVLYEPPPPEASQITKKARL